MGTFSLILFDGPNRINQSIDKIFLFDQVFDDRSLGKLRINKLNGGISIQNLLYNFQNQLRRTERELIHRFSQEEKPLIIEF